MIELIEKLGLPVGLLVIIGLAIWRILIYLGAKVVEPLVIKHTEFIEQIKLKSKSDSENMKSLSDNVVKQTENMEKQTQAITEILKLEVAENASLDDLHRKHDELHSKTDTLLSRNNNED